MPTKVNIEMDEHELELCAQANDYIALQHRKLGNTFSARHHEILATKQRNHIKAFQAQHTKAFAERYHFDIHIHVGGQTREVL